MTEKEAESYVLLEDCKIIFRNFTGKETPMNREGDRNFCVLLDPNDADNLIREGWNVKFLQPREEGDIPQPYLQVKVMFGKYPPKIVMVAATGKTKLDEKSVEILDWTEIQKADLTIRPYTWSVNGKNGIKAYLKSLYVTIVEDPLELKYLDAPGRPDSVKDSYDFVAENYS